MSEYTKRILLFSSAALVIAVGVASSIFYLPTHNISNSTSTTEPSYLCSRGTDTITPQYQYNYVNNNTSTTQTIPKYVSVMDLPAGCSGSIIMTIHFPNNTVSNNTFSFAPSLNLYSHPTAVVCLFPMRSGNATSTMNCSGIIGSAYPTNATSSPNLTFNVTIEFSVPKNITTIGVTYVLEFPTINCAVDFFPPMFIGNNIAYWNPPFIQSCSTNPMVYPEITSVSIVNFTGLSIPTGLTNQTK
jgi:hypothetical protein